MNKVKYIIGVKVFIIFYYSITITGRVSFILAACLEGIAASYQLSHLRAGGQTGW